MSQYKDEWDVYEVGYTPHRVDEVHVIPHNDDLPHTFTKKCACEPDLGQDLDQDSAGLPVYIHNVVYYN